MNGVTSGFVGGLWVRSKGFLSCFIGGVMGGV
jgi:fructose-specific phosphotransferase system IIC component